MHYAKTFFLGAALLLGTIHCSGGSGEVTPAENASPSDPSKGNESDTDNEKKAEGSGSDASTPEDPKPTPNPNPNTCNTLVNDATAISFVDVVAENAPVPTGGTLVNGTYRLKSLTLYAGPNGKATKLPINVRHTVKLIGNVLEQAFDGTKNNGEVVHEQSTETISTTGSVIDFTVTCPDSKSRSGSYSVNGSTMTLFLKNDVGQTVAYAYAP